MKTRAAVAVILAVALACAAGPVAIVAQQAQDRLASVTTLTCTFPLVAVGSWTKGVAEAAVKPAKLQIKFDIFEHRQWLAL